jgi:hypothetical protein
MPRRKPSGPPRPIAPGDVVAAYSEPLGEWTAAQITDLNADWKTAGILELDWSGPEPGSTADLGEVCPLRLTHHAWNGKLSHCNYEWILPRSYKVIGSMPLIHTEPSHSFSKGWRLGEQLAHQRRWDSGNHEPWSDPRTLDLTGNDLDQALDQPAALRDEIRALSITPVESLDCERLAEGFPNLTRLSLAGNLGELVNAASLNRLPLLKTLFITDLFGMTKSDCLLPEHVPGLESLGLHSIPHEYAAAMRAAWRPEIPNGTSLEITGARKPEWVKENLTNPLRDWDGRQHISSARYKQAVAQYKATRRAVLAALAEGSNEDRSSRLVQIGREFSVAFNKLDGRSPFIETEEREELFAALDAIVTEAEEGLDVRSSGAREDLLSGVESVRDW